MSRATYTLPSGARGRHVYDSTSDTTLDCELLAVRDLNGAAIATGTVAKIGFVAFAGTNTDTLTNITSAAALDLSPLGGVSTLTAPNANEFTAPPSMTTALTGTRRSARRRQRRAARRRRAGD
jgi:hypothetical protein